MEKLLTIADAASKLGVTPKTLRIWDKEGKLKSVRTLGNHRRYKFSEIENFYEKRMDD